MATTFKTLKSEDKVLTRNVLHEAIPITGSIVSGTYSDNNIKNYSHGMFQSVYDYPYLSSSANHIFDITLGTSDLSSSANGNFTSSLDPVIQSGSKGNIYAQMAQVLCGHYADGSIRPFDVSGSLSSTNPDDKMKEVYFINFARLLTKDEIKKGTFEIKLGTSQAYATPFNDVIKLFDSGSASNYKVNSPAGEFGLLYAETVTVSADNCAVVSDLAAGTAGARPVGLVFYQAGIAVLTSSVFFPAGTNGGILGGAAAATGSTAYLGDGSPATPGLRSVTAQFVDVAISGNCDNLRNRIQNISFNNTTELNSTVYFCRANAHEFNYSSNPTYLSGSQIRVRDAANPDAEPVAYVTTVGLYGKNNEMLAVAKTSEPLKKSPSNELTLRVRLDY